MYNNNNYDNSGSSSHSNNGIVVRRRLVSPVLRRLAFRRETVPWVLHPDNVAAQPLPQNFKAPSDKAETKEHK